MSILSPEARSAWTQFGYTLGEQMRQRALNDGFKKYINEDYAEFKTRMGDIIERNNAVDTSKPTDEISNHVMEIAKAIEELATQSSVNYPGNTKVSQHIEMLNNVYLNKWQESLKLQSLLGKEAAQTEQAQAGAEESRETTALRRDERGLIPAREEALKAETFQRRQAGLLSGAQAKALGGAGGEDPLAKVPPEQIPSYIETSDDFAASRNRMEMALSLKAYKAARERSPNTNPVTGQPWDPSMKVDLPYFAPDYKDVIKETVANETLIRAPLHPEWGLPSNPTREDIDVIFPVETFETAEVGPRPAPGLTGNYSPREVAETLVGKDVVRGLEDSFGVTLRKESDILKAFPQDFDQMIELNKSAGGELGPFIFDIARFAESHGRVPTEFADPSEMEGGLGPRIGTFDNLKELLTDLYDKRINHIYGFKSTESALPPPDESLDPDTLRSRRRARSVAARLLFMYLTPLAEELDLEGIPSTLQSIFGVGPKRKTYYKGIAGEPRKAFTVNFSGETYTGDGKRKK